jgi:hypothetical protein
VERGMLLGHPEFLLIWVMGSLAPCCKICFNTCGEFLVHREQELSKAWRACKPAFVANLFTRRILLIKYEDEKESSRKIRDEKESSRKNKKKRRFLLIF